MRIGRECPKCHRFLYIDKTDQSMAVVDRCCTLNFNGPTMLTKRFNANKPKFESVRSFHNRFKTVMCHGCFTTLSLNKFTEIKV